MSDSYQTEQHLSEISGLFRRHLGISGASVSEQIKRGRRKLPAQAQEAADIISEAESLAAHPQLRPLIDTGELAHATSILRGHLRGSNATARRSRMVMGALRTLVFNIFAVSALVILVLIWRGFL